MRLQHCGVAREYSSPPPVCSFASVQSAANILWILSSGELLSTMFKTILSSVFLMAFFFFSIKLISKIWTDYSWILMQFLECHIHEIFSKKYHQYWWVEILREYYLEYSSWPPVVPTWSQLNPQTGGHPHVQPIAQLPRKYAEEFMYQTKKLYIPKLSLHPSLCCQTN